MSTPSSVSYKNAYLYLHNLWTYTSRVYKLHVITKKLLIIKMHLTSFVQAYIGITWNERDFIFRVSLVWWESIEKKCGKVFGPREHCGVAFIGLVHNGTHLTIYHHHHCDFIDTSFLWRVLASARWFVYSNHITFGMSVESLIISSSHSGQSAIIGKNGVRSNWVITNQMPANNIPTTAPHITCVHVWYCR